MKKKVLFVISGLTIGGAENSLIKLLNYIKNDYEIDLLLLTKCGSLIEKVPKEVKLLYLYNPKDKWRNNPILNVIRIGLYIINKAVTFSLRYTSIYYHFIRLVKIRKKYDVEIAYLEPYPFQFIATAPKKTKTICSVRNSLDNPERRIAPKWYLKSVEKSFNKVDKVFCVSEDATKEFKIMYPQDKDKVCTIDNFFEFDEIRQKSEVSINYKFDKTKINVATVGRCSYQKGYLRLLSAHNKLIKEGFNHVLHIVGRYLDQVDKYYGEGEQIIRFIKKNNLQDTVVLHGEVSNPFPYIKKADIYVSSAYYEGYPRSITEALILKKPIVATDVSGSAYVLGYGKYGMLVKDSEEGLYEGLKKMIGNKAIREKYINNSKEFKDRKIEIINEIKKLIEE